ALFERRLELARATRDRRGEAIATGNLGLVLAALGDYQEAGAAYQKHRALSADIGYRRGEGIALVNLAQLRIDEGQLDAAERALRYLAESRELVAALSIDVPGPLPAAYLALAGCGEPPEVGEEAPVGVRAEAHVVLHRAGIAGPHLERARALLATLSRHLQG